jgi:hypothetical protein
LVILPEKPPDGGFSTLSQGHIAPVLLLWILINNILVKEIEIKQPLKAAIKPPTVVHCYIARFAVT